MSKAKKQTASADRQGQTWTVTIHRFQPKKGRHQNQSFELCGSTDEMLSPTMMLAFGDVQATAVYDLVARTHAVTQIQIDSVHAAIHIFTAPTEIRPYTDKLAKDHTKITEGLYAPLDTDRCAQCGTVRLMHDQAMSHGFVETSANDDMSAYRSGQGAHGEPDWMDEANKELERLMDKHSV